MLKGLIYCDTRFWEIFNEKNESIGIYMYGDLINEFAPQFGQYLNMAYSNLKSQKYTWKIIGDVMPYDVDSENPIIQKKKIEFRKREAKKDKKHALKKGFKLDDTIKFGKYSGDKIKNIIDNHSSYWKWILKENILLLHPETKTYSDSKI